MPPQHHRQPYLSTASWEQALTITSTEKLCYSLIQ